MVHVVLLEFSSRCAFGCMRPSREDGGKPYLHKSPSGSSGTCPPTHEIWQLLLMYKYFLHGQAIKCDVASIQNNQESEGFVSNLCRPMI